MSIALARLKCLFLVLFLAHSLVGCSVSGPPGTRSAGTIYGMTKWEPAKEVMLRDRLETMSNAAAIVLTGRGPPLYRPDILIDGVKVGEISDGKQFVFIVKPDVWWIKAAEGFVGLGCSDEEIKETLKAGEVRHFIVTFNASGCVRGGSRTLFRSVKNSAILPGASGYLVRFSSVGDIGYERRTPEQQATDEANLAASRAEYEAKSKLEAEQERTKAEAVRVEGARKAFDAERQLEREKKVRDQLIENERLRVAREGDGSPDDLTCKQRRLKPQSAGYEKCRVSLAEHRAKEEAGRRSSEANKSAAEKEQDNKLPAPATAVQAVREKTKPRAADSSYLDEAKAKCVDLGFKLATEAFGKCVLQLSK